MAIVQARPVWRQVLAAGFLAVGSAAATAGESGPDMRPAPQAPGQVDAAGVDPALIAALIDWIALRTEMPPPSAPAVRLTTPADLAMLYRTQGAAETPQGPPRHTGPVAALYDSRARVILLPSDWTPDAAGLSALVHELVHHAQAAADRRYACPAAREAEAYALQAAWLEQFGMTLEEAYGINRMALFLLTHCGM